MGSSGINTGTYMFVPPGLYGAVKEYISKEALKLGPDHAMVTEEWEAVVMQVVGSLPRKYKVTVQNQGICEVQHDNIPSGGQDGTWKGKPRIEIIVLRSFIEVKVPSSLFSGPSGGPRT